jgi:hypothetical protein
VLEFGFSKGSAITTYSGAAGYAISSATSNVDTEILVVGTDNAPWSNTVCFLITPGWRSAAPSSSASPIKDISLSYSDDGAWWAVGSGAGD